MKQKRQRGLSLLELLVVLVIVGLVSSLLLQGLGFGLSLFERVHTRSEAAKQEILIGEWFRRVNESLVAKPASTGTSLVGTPVSLAATTMSPLLGVSGVPQEVSWRIEDENLWYEESGVSMPVMNVPLNASFSFRTQDGRWLSNWPSDGNFERLPKAVAVDGVDKQLLVAALRVREMPDLLLEDSRRERE